MSIDFSPGMVQRDPTTTGGYLGFEVSVAAAGSAAMVRISGTQFIDSTGLSVLVGGLRRLQERGGSMVVQSPTPATRRLFDITGLSPVFDIS